MKELWKDIVGYEGYYQISNFGNVKSLDRVDGIGRTIKGHLLKWKHNNRGYFTISLNKNGKARYFLVHRLVATMFIKNPDNLPEVNHIDEDKSNNSVDNLEWCTSEYNHKYGTREERRLSNTDFSFLVERNKISGYKNFKPIVAIYPNGRLRRFDSQKNAAIELGISGIGINAVLKKRQKTHKGYRFEYDSDKLVAEWHV